MHSATLNGMTVTGIAASQSSGSLANTAFKNQAFDMCIALIHNGLLAAD